MAPDISLTLDPSDGSVLSDDLDESGEIDLDDLDTPSEDSNEFEWEGRCFIDFNWPLLVIVFMYIHSGIFTWPWNQLKSMIKGFYWNKMLSILKFMYRL